jgi:hypothetical protein
VIELTPEGRRDVRRDNPPVSAQDAAALKQLNELMKSR